ncbi:Endo-1,4-beta-xylanase B precursor [[Actinomadura] parvosata subsp. kistnae]|uniref:alpha/beta hydrolase n=1 Tax=[Actinomadura] parvosata TaxID=1955412 RepID=UPI000D2DFA18|nr:Endo-1,4-beta-xylanase B precursor [Actinomadura parvosata subsp. kistnae]
MIGIPLWPAAPPGPATGEPPRLTRYGAGAPTTSAVVVCPGGGYARLAEHESADVARWLVTLGLDAYVLHYRVAGGEPVCQPLRPAPLYDLRQAVKVVRERGATRVAVMGFSAGGHLAATLAVAEDGGERPDAVVLGYPVIDLTGAQSSSRRRLLDTEGGEKQAAALSAHLNVTTGTPPAFLWHTAADQVVPVGDSLLLAAALARAGTPFELHVFPGSEHELGLAQDDPAASAWTGLCAAWLAAQGFGPRL